MKNQLFILVLTCLFLNTISAQTDSTWTEALEIYEANKAREMSNTSIVEIKVYDDATDIPIADVHFTFVKDGREAAIFLTKYDGTYKVRLKEGIYQMYINHPRYDITKMGLTIKAGEPLEKIIRLKELVKPAPEEPGEEIQDIYGFWKVVYIDDGENRIEQPEQIGRSGVGFFELDPHKPGLGKFYYNDGCNYAGNYWFKYYGNGEMEMGTEIYLSKTDIGCKINHELEKAVPKLIGKYQVTFIGEDEMNMKNDAIEFRVKRTDARSEHYISDRGIMTGKIVDKDANTPIKNVYIRAKDIKHRLPVYTAEDGTFRLKLGKGEHEISVYHPCYEPKTIKIDVVERTTIDQVIELEKTAQPEKHGDTTSGKCTTIKDLEGSWKVDYIEHKGKKIKQPKQIEPSHTTLKHHWKEGQSLQGQLNYSDGHCIQSTRFSFHIKDAQQLKPPKHRDKNMTPYYCKQTNIPLIQAMRLLGDFNYTFNGDNILIIESEHTKYLKIQLSRIDTPVIIDNSNKVSEISDSSVVEVKVYDDVTNRPLSEIRVTFMKDGREAASSNTGHDGTCSVKLKEGVYKMYVGHQGSDHKKIDIKVEAGQNIEQIVKLKQPVWAIPQEPGEAIPKLYGFWRVLCIDDGKKKIKQPKQIAESGIGFSKLNEHKTGVGRVSFNEGCKSIRGLWFKHHGSGEIEMPTGITESYDVGCPEYNYEIRKLIPKLIDRFHVRFIQNDKMIIKNDSIEIRLKRVS